MKQKNITTIALAHILPTKIRDPFYLVNPTGSSNPFELINKIVFERKHEYVIPWGIRELGWK